MRASRRLANRLARHWRWGRAEGFDRLLEEDGVRPVERLRQEWHRWRWTRANGVAPGSARPVFVVGVQRSGTNMLLRGLAHRPDVRIYNENDSRAFVRFRLRGDAQVLALVDASRQPIVVFKPLCDSHRTDELLALTPPERQARAVWLHRDVDGRVRSAVAKFGDVNRRVLTDIAAGRTEGRWQAERLSPDSLAFLRELDVPALSPESAAALFWYLRNELFFSLGLDGRDDVLPVAYDVLVRDPEPVMRRVCAFLGTAYTPEVIAHVDHRSVRPTQQRLAIDAAIRERCDDLTTRLLAAGALRGMPPQAAA